MLLNEKILRILRTEKITPEELQYMLDHAAITSIRNCNRRYHHWVFRVEKNVLEDMQLFDIVELGEGEQAMMEMHESCEGKGCPGCRWIGEFSRRIKDETAVKLDDR